MSMKISILILQMLVLLFFNFDMNNNLTTNMNVPSEVQAGMSFEVNISIDKGNIQNFARFQQKLPYGLEAQPISTDNAEFKFEDNEVKLIWLKLPEKKEVNVAYAIHVKNMLKGDFNISGEFAYIKGNERMSQRFTPKNITITPSPDIDESRIVDIEDYQNRFIPVSSRKENVACIRRPPQISPDNNEINIELLVHKKNIDQFAKIEEHIPPGYIAKQNNTQNGIFVAKEQTVKFLWIQLPSPDNFTVSYKLIPKPEVELKKPDIDGVFSYIKGEQTKSIQTVQKDINFNAIGPDASLSEILNDTLGITQEIEGIATTQVIPDDDDSMEETTPDQPIEEQEVHATEQQPEEEEEEEEEMTAQTESSNIPFNRESVQKSHILEPQTGVYYRVQIAAGHKPVEIKDYFSRYKLNETVKREQHEGWYKYSIGSFDVYKKARDKRVNIWETTKINDAFVTSYNNGVRITVQEALMITNQEWYK